MKLYTGPLSLFSKKVEVALDEKAIACERISVPFSLETLYEPKHPDVVRLNPKAQVPVLVDGELAVYDSTLIFEYLEARVPEPPLYPIDLAGKTLCRQAELEADEVFFPHAFALFPHRDVPDAEREAARNGIADHYRRLDGRLGDRKYLFERFSVADISHFLVSQFTEMLGVPVPSELRFLRAWQDRIGGRPSVAPHVATMREAAGMG